VLYKFIDAIRYRLISQIHPLFLTTEWPPIKCCIR